MAPAITSDTAPCSRAPCLLTRDPTSLFNVALTDLGETAVNMNSQTMPSSQDGKDAAADAVGSLPFHPFARLASSRSAVSSESLQATDPNMKQELHLVDAAGQVLPEMMNGVGVSPSPNLSSLNLSNACRVSLKSVPPRTVSIVIKNSGAGNVSNSVRGPVLQTCVTSGSCNGGSGCADANVAVPARHVARPDGTCGQYIARPATSLHRMLITPRMPGCDTGCPSGVSTTGRVADSINAVQTQHDDVGNMQSRVEQLQVVQSKSNNELAAGVCEPDHSTARSDGLTLDAVLTRQRSLASRASRTLLRLRRLQSREANSSVRRQLGGLVSALRRSACQSAAMNDISAVRSTPDLKSMSTLELVGFVRQMQSTEAMSAVAQSSKCSSIQLSVCPDMADTADRLSSNLRHLESAMDSDATESSSGGETDDEVEPTPAANDEYVVVSDT